jgi:hypothetical protein
MPDAAISPPYLPYKTFVGSFARLAEGIPRRIDRQIWKNHPGSIQGQIFSAYRFFELISGDGMPSSELESLVSAGDEFSVRFAPVFQKYYDPVLKHSLATMTPRLLAEEFEASFGTEGETKKKAIRFFLQAAKEVGLPLSRFLLDQSRAPAAPKRRRAQKREPDLREDEGTSYEVPSTVPGKTYKTIRLESGGELALSMSVDLFDLTGKDRIFVFGLIDSFKKYELESARKDPEGGNP